MVTLVATILPVLIGGSIIVEVVFDLPGMGKYAYEGLLRRDFHVVMATTLLTGVMTQLGILASDLLYTLVDPRIQAA
jgi:peptide/nickel transport system permease protein